MLASSPRSFLPDRLAGRRELGRRAERRRLRLLAAGVGVDLGVEHQDVDVAAAGEHVVEPAVADVVGPAVAADQPHALLHQVVGEGLETARLGGLDCSAAPAAAPRPARAAPRCRPRSPGRRRAARRRARRRAAAPGARPARAPRRRARRARAGTRSRTRRCPRTASSPTPDRGRRGWWCRAWSAGCRRRSTSSRWRWRSAGGRRRAG